MGFSFEFGRLGRRGPLGRSWDRFIGVGASVARDLSHTNAVARFAAHTLFMRAHILRICESTTILFIYINLSNTFVVSLNVARRIAHLIISLSYAQVLYLHPFVFLM